MKVSIKCKSCDLDNEDLNLYKKFIKFLNINYPVKENVKIIFTGERIDQMSTGSRNNNHELKEIPFLK